MKIIANITYPTIALFAFACFALSPIAHAVTPAPDGGYPGQNTAEGEDALFSGGIGIGNTTAIGYRALYSSNNSDGDTAIGSFALYRETSGFGNTATGFAALSNNVSGSYNTAVGNQAMGGDTTNSSGSYNTATGFGTLVTNRAANNTANGALALSVNSTGTNNTATGFNALLRNNTGSNNTAMGVGTLAHNTTGTLNTANGVRALNSNTTGIKNTATGESVLKVNTIGNYNACNGNGALFANTTGNNNTAEGVNALFNNTTGSSNIALGFSAGNNVTTANDVICIGAGVTGANVSNSCFIGNIRGVSTHNANAIPVVVDSAGQLGTMSSSRRFKEKIKAMDTTSEAILALKPVTFQYNGDKTSTPQFGLIAEDVEKANPDLVVRDADAKVYTVRYEAVNAMLLNEFLKEHQTVDELKSATAKQEAMIASQQKQIETLTAAVQKVSAQLEVSKPAPQTVLNNQ